MGYTLKQLQQEIAFQLARDYGDVTTSLKDLVVLGLSGESGEVCELRKRELRHNFRDTKILENIREEYVGELGDVLWYLCAVCSCMGISLDEVWEYNVKKLNERYGGAINGAG